MDPAIVAFGLGVGVLVGMTVVIAAFPVSVAVMVIAVLVRDRRNGRRPAVPVGPPSG